MEETKKKAILSMYPRKKKTAGKVIDVRVVNDPLTVSYAEDNKKMPKTFGEICLEDEDKPKGVELETGYEVMIVCRGRVSNVRSDRWNDYKKRYDIEITKIESMTSKDEDKD